MQIAKLQNKPGAVRYNIIADWVSPAPPPSPSDYTTLHYTTLHYTTLHYTTGTEHVTTDKEPDKYKWNVYL